MTFIDITPQVGYDSHCSVASGIRHLFSVKAAMSSSRFIALSSITINLHWLTLQKPKETEHRRTYNEVQMAKLALDPNAKYTTYIMQSGCGRYVKIGYTCNLKKRFSEVKCEAAR